MLKLLLLAAKEEETRNRTETESLNETEKCVPIKEHITDTAAQLSCIIIKRQNILPWLSE